MEALEILDAARAGDESAFGRIVEAHHHELHVHCYRMLGSPQDAEDAMQEVFLRAWRALHQLDGADGLRPWLYRIATNVCLDAIRRRRPRRLPPDVGPPTEPGAGPAADPGEPHPGSWWIEPYPDEQLAAVADPSGPEARYDQREAVELAFIAALQHLPARQRAVLILRDVLSFPAHEVAQLLGVTVVAVNSLRQRARRTLDDELPDRSQQTELRRLGDDRVGALVTRLADAFEQGDVDSIVGMLVEDATFSMPPYAAWYQGRQAISGSWLMPDRRRPRLRVMPTRANGQPALAFYRIEANAGAYLALALDVLTIRDGRIADVTAFRSPSLFRYFDLPATVEPAGADGRREPRADTRSGL